MKKNLKKIIACSVLVATLLIPTTEALAWGGYAHWEMTQRSSSIPSTYKKHAASGALIADIGRGSLITEAGLGTSWDDFYGVSSDGATFSSEMGRLANSYGGSANLYFAKGWAAHYNQDLRTGEMYSISGCPSGYAGYGWIDEYLRDIKKISTPINGKTTAIINYGLIGDTYYNVTNGRFNPSTTQIDVELAELYRTYEYLTLLSIGSYTEAQKSAIESKLNSVSSNTTYSLAKDSSIKDDFDIVANILKNDKVKAEKFRNKYKEFVDSNLSRIERKKLDNDFYEVLYVITDQNKYDKYMNELVQIMNE